MCNEESSCETKLILIEGIPGSGKTTTARFVCDWLKRHGQHPALFQEGDWNHPADFESVACLDEREYAEIGAQFPEQASLLAQQAWQENGEWFFSYRKMQHEYGEQIPMALFETLAHFEIYELPAEKHRRLLLRRWQNFAARAATEKLVYIFECCFLQNPITTLLARHNLPTETVHQHVLALSKIVEPLHPKLVYLAQDDPRATLNDVRKERPQAWADYVTWYLTGQEYGKAHGLSGFEGVILFYTILQAIELEFLSTLPIPSIVILDNTDWATRYKHLTAFLEI